VNDDELMPIGHFARVCGLSIHALRHYDEVDLLRPAEVDSSSGYRLYHRGQIRTAKLIRALRWIDLPIEEIRQVLDGNDQTARAVLAVHRRRLERQRNLLSARIGDVDHFQENGIIMPTVSSGCRPVQIKIAVNDVKESIAFYQDAFALTYDITRRTADGDYSGFAFGEYEQDTFFLLHLMDDQDDTDRLGPATFGLLVDDLDARHAGAVAAGGTEVVPPHSPEGMPRCSAVKDPSGNWIWLYQG
jgi:DNA-binding transcriptional MerR regulator